MGREWPLEVYGPKGIGAMTTHVLQAWEVDIANRLHGMERATRSGHSVNVHEISPGLIYSDANVRVTAFAVNHGELCDAFGFRLETADRTIVISGDTAPTPALVENCRDCDVLIHEAYSLQTYRSVSRKWQAYRRNYHTSSQELAELANKVQPRLLVLYHRSNPGGMPPAANAEEVLLDEIREFYKGDVVTGHD